MELGETLYVHNRGDLRKWLAKNHRTKKELWLIFYKRSSGKPSIGYDEAVEEALCYGWVDGQEKSIDFEKYALRFTPRKKASNWSESNRQRVRKLLAQGKMTKAGREALPPDLMRTAMKVVSQSRKKK